MFVTIKVFLNVALILFLQLEEENVIVSVLCDQTYQYITWYFSGLRIAIDFVKTCVS